MACLLVCLQSLSFSGLLSYSPCLLVCLPACLYVCLPACVSASLSACLSVCWSHPLVSVPQQSVHHGVHACELGQGGADLGMQFSVLLVLVVKHGPVIIPFLQALHRRELPVVSRKYRLD